VSSRLGEGDLCTLRNRIHFMADIYRVTRRDGVQMHLTGSDHNVVHRGVLYRSMGGASQSGGVAEAGLAGGDIELIGLLTAEMIQGSDLLAGLYDDARVDHWVVDTGPGRSHKEYAHRVWWVDSMHRDGNVWQAQMSSVQRFLRENVGRVFDTHCDYVLGDPATCRKDLSSFRITNGVVDTVTSTRSGFTATTISWPGTFADQTYRGGDITWKTGNNVGVVSKVGSYVHTGRVVRLYIPTPFPIRVGDTFDAAPGCDGSVAACYGIYNNIVNHGQNPFQTNANTTANLLEPSL